MADPKPLITEAELIQCKRAVLVLSEISKASMTAMDMKAPLGLKQDMLVLTQLLRRLERQAHKEPV